MLFHRLFSTPVGIVTMILNVPIFIWGMKVLGKTYIVKSIIAVIISSLLIDFFTYVLPLGPATANTLLSALYGGVLLGVGLGIIFRGQASTGGTDIIGQIINRFSNFSVGTAILVVDFIIVSIAGLTFRNFELALYGYLTLFLSIKVIDIVLEGISYTRAAFIITDRPKLINDAILSELQRGVTRLQSMGGYSNIPKETLFVVLSKRQVSELVNIVEKQDANAFIVITDVYEVLGRGFRSRIPQVPQDLIGMH
jgi:uncharacterized membrane-anchored protein YitT (DUF2179 family)